MLLAPLAVDAWVTIWAYPHEAVRYGPARWDLGTFAPAGLICMPLAYARMHDVGRQAIATSSASPRAGCGQSMGKNKGTCT